jgi:hypothetical protein
MAKDSILYIGNKDHSNFDNKEVKAILSLNLIYIRYEEGFESLFNTVLKTIPSLILIDIPEVTHSFLSFLILLKSHSLIQNIKIIGLFSDKDGFSKHSDLYSFGLEYSFLRSEEKKRMLYDIGYIINSSNFEPEKYATVNSLNIIAKVSFLAKVSHISDKFLEIETSMNLTINSLVEIKSFLKESYPLTFFKVANKNTFLPRSYFSGTCSLQVLYQGDEQEFDIKDILPSRQDYQKLLKELTKNSFRRNDPALIIDQRSETLIELLDELNTNNSYIKITNTITGLDELIPIFLPQIICYQMEDEPENYTDDELLKYNGRTSFNKLLLIIKSIPNYNPFVLVFGDKSRSQAYRKAYLYNKIIVNKKPLELEYLLMIIQEYQSSRPIKDNIIYFKSPDPRTIIEIKDEIHITSISENIITFLSDKELNMYTTFKIDVPLNIYITVVPKNINLENKNNLIHYYGFI